MGTELTPDSELMWALERAVALNLQDYVAAFRRVVPEVDAACSKFAHGVAAFTGLDSPLTTVKGTGAQISTRDLEEIESFFRDHHAPSVTIESAPWLNEESKALLVDRGYGVAGQENVVATTSGSPRSDEALRTEPIPVHEWPEVLRRCSGLPDESPMKELVTASAHLTNAALYGLREGGRWIACAQSVTCNSVVIFGNDATLPEARGRGAQTALSEERHAALPAGTIVMAEVAPGSASERNYLRCGSQIVFPRKHYARVLP